MKYNASEQTVAWFKDRYMEGSLEIRPPYQRRPVWTIRQKSNLIESILLKLPVPEIYIHTVTSEDGSTTYAVVDGQQRVRTILQFIGLDKDEAEQEENRFSLEDLPDDSKWRNTSFDDLAPEKKKQFFGHQMAVRFLTDSTEEEVRDLFRRLNRYLTKLNDQELRNATYSGPLVRLVAELADDDFWAENGIVSAALIRRMKDMEFVSELLFAIMDGPQGSSAKILDEYYLQLEPYAEEFPKQKTIKRSYVKTLNLIKELYPDIRKTRWKNRTDFYSLFVVFAELLVTHILQPAQHTPLKKALSIFIDEVDLRIEDESARVSKLAAEYARNAIKGVSDRSRRMVRHSALMPTVKTFFKESAKSKT
jgi:Protein of unknown function DUF262